MSNVAPFLVEFLVDCCDKVQNEFQTNMPWEVVSQSRKLIELQCFFRTNAFPNRRTMSHWKHFRGNLCLYRRSLLQSISFLRQSVASKGILSGLLKRKIPIREVEKYSWLFFFLEPKVDFGEDKSLWQLRLWSNESIVSFMVFLYTVNKNKKYFLLFHRHFFCTATVKLLQFSFSRFL